jgi:signal transduction histidine kinase
VLLGLLLVAQWHRSRVRRLVEVQRVRERIASDLHDELGLSLSRISILSEVARRDAEGRGAPSEELELIGETARSLIDATSDMAWALDPSKDNLGSLLKRVRRLAGGVCEGAGVKLEVRVEEELKAFRLAPEVRRHILLILKEAIHNALRHGAPSTIVLRACRSPGGLELRIEDDGAGFDPASPTIMEKEGHGLSSMSRRAREAGGALRIVSGPEKGTTVTILLPISHNGIPA